MRKSTLIDLGKIKNKFGSPYFLEKDFHEEGVIFNSQNKHGYPIFLSLQHYS